MGSVNKLSVFGMRLFRLFVSPDRVKRSTDLGEFNSSVKTKTEWASVISKRSAQGTAKKRVANHFLAKSNAT
jgi:hypothetical protein